MAAAHVPDQVPRRPRVLAIMHHPLAVAGLIGEAIEAAGGRMTVLMPHRADEAPAEGRPDPLPAGDGGFDGLLVLGGAMHAGDDRGHPHFPPLLDLIRRFHERRKPVLGICLGAQLIGRAFGAEVRPQGFLEFGFEPVDLTDQACDDPLLAGLPGRFRAMQWHEDAVGLPEGATHLAAGEACPNQIFRVGPTTYAFQCHIEVTPAMVRSWVRARARTIGAGPAFLARFEADLDRYMKDATAIGRAVAGRWLTLFGPDPPSEENAAAVSGFTESRAAGA